MAKNVKIAAKKKTKQLMALFFEPFVVNSIYFDLNCFFDLNLICFADCCCLPKSTKLETELKIMATLLRILDNNYRDNQKLL